MIGLDTSPLIYFIEEHPQYLPIGSLFFQADDRNEIQVVTSTVSITKVLIRPFRDGESELALRYQDILVNSRGVSCIPVSEAISVEAARLRAENRIRTPDSLQLATAIVYGADAFLTNDTNLPDIPNLQVLVLDRL